MNKPVDLIKVSIKSKNNSLGCVKKGIAIFYKEGDLTNYLTSRSIDILSPNNCYTIEELLEKGIILNRDIFQKSAEPFEIVVEKY